MSPHGAGRSTPQGIAHALRDELLDGAIPPGARLTEESLVERFASGRHSVRAALQLLVAEGLLEHHRNRGIVVPDVTAARIDDMFAYRTALEMGALRLALARDADFAAAIAAVARLEHLDPDAPWRVVTEAHSDVHRGIVEAGGSARLTAAHAACQNELNCMLAIVRTDFSAERLAAMHRELLVGLLAGGETALAALEDDLENGGRAAMHVALERRLAAAASTDR
jgi:DNA-binding GntR family transcriptional regulator